VSGFVPKNLAVMPFEFCMKMKDPRVLRGDKDRLCIYLLEIYVRLPKAFFTTPLYSPRLLPKYNLWPLDAASHY